MNKINKVQKIMINLMALALLVLAVNSVSAGSLTPAAAPTDSASAMFTLEDLYNRLNLGTAGSKRSGAFADPGSAPGSTMHNLNDIMSKAPAVDVSGAADGEVLTGRKYWGLTTGHWGPRIGSMANVGAQSVMPTTASQTITQGYHDGSGKVAGDANLVTGNIKAGATIFGVTGKTEVVDTTSGDAVAGEIFSGKKAWVDGNEVTGTLETKTLSAASDTVAAGYYIATTLSFVDTDLVTGNIRAGVNLFGVNGNAAVVNTSSGNATAGELLYTRTAWINGQEITGTRLGGVILKAGGSFSAGKRWYDNADGTITDVTTGLVWLKNLPIADRTFIATPTDQIDCFRFCGELQNGTNGLTDGSRLNDWRPPTIREMQSMRTGTEPIGGGNWQLFPNYSGIGSYSYWTVSLDSVEPGKVQTIHMTTGVLVPKYRYSEGGDSIRGLVWPVRNAFIP